MDQLVKAIDKDLTELLSAATVEETQGNEDKALVEEAMRVGALNSVGIPAEFKD